MLLKIRQNKRLQLIFGLLTGIFFGFFLQVSGVTYYDVILGQLLLYDFTVVKVMLTAVIVGMLGVYFMRQFGWVQLHPKPGSLDSTVIGGLVFGVLGYCPGTLSGAIGQGSLDALFTGSIGIIIGSWLFANWYPRLQRLVLSKGDFGSITLPELLKVNAWIIIIPVVILLTALLFWIEKLGL
jgi:hypothetical protein